MTDARLILIPKPDLSEAQLRLVEERIAAPEHARDLGPSTVWSRYVAPNQIATLYAFFHREDSAPVGLVEASGPSRAINPGWWIDSKYRGQKYGNELVDLLAEHLKSKGVTGVGHITVTTYQGAHDEASFALKRRFKAHFESGG